MRGRRRKEKEVELDAHRLEQRIKQIAYGENTRGFTNLMKVLERDPSLVKGCIPVKPAIHQKCSKRSWDGQVRKWRRALHMYDYVDFGESEEQSKEVREALVVQNINPVFTPAKSEPGALKYDLFSPMRGTTWAEEFDSPFAPSPDMSHDAASHVREDLSHCSPIRFCVTKAHLDVEPTAGVVPPPAAAPKLPIFPRVRYSIEHLMQLAESPLVAEEIHLPDALGWLDKRVDLEDDVESESEYSPSLDLRSPVAQRFLFSPYEHAPTTPRRLSLTIPTEGLELPGSGFGLGRWAEDDFYDSRTGMTVDWRSQAGGGSRRASIGNASVTFSEPGDMLQTRTPLRQVARPVAKAATALKKRSTFDAFRYSSADKENLPPSLFCTPPRRPYHLEVESSPSLYSRLVGFL
eukprot:GGOE01003732.1.p1 GENE.GGOE01003732.1~~GGOE01003732.1.p1  ORF type:complete len:406 (-),score=75.17 GGOE01003732.1:220-1437(-)